MTTKPGTRRHVCGYSTGAGSANQFVTIRDTRPPTCRGNLSVARTAAVQATATSPVTHPCRALNHRKARADEIRPGATTVSSTATVNGSVGATGDVTGRGICGCNNRTCLRTVVMTSSSVIAIRDPGCTDAITLDGTGRAVSPHQCWRCSNRAINSGAGAVHYPARWRLEAATAGTSCAAMARAYRARCIWARGLLGVPSGGVEGPQP